MAIVHYPLDPVLTQRLAELPLTPHDRERAQAQLEFAMAMADLAVRAAEGLRKFGRTFSAVLTSRRDFVRGGLLHAD